MDVPERDPPPGGIINERAHKLPGGRRYFNRTKKPALAGEGIASQDGLAEREGGPRGYVPTLPHRGAYLEKGPLGRDPLFYRVG